MLTLNKFLKKLGQEPTYQKKKSLIWHLTKYEEATGEKFIFHQKNGQQVKINDKLLIEYIPTLLEYT